MRTHGYYDPYQYAYRKNKNIMQALLFFTLRVLQGFRRKEVTTALFIDLEGAYDTIWRAGLLLKLSKAGLCGNLLHFIMSYLEKRTIICKVNNYTSDALDSYTGVPQGSVISPLLFIFYIHEDNIIMNELYS